MRADLQAILNASVGSTTYPVSTGHEPGNKMCVLAWLYLKSMAPNVNFNLPNIVNKVTGMQGVTPDNMIDLQIEGLATYFGYGNYTWANLLSTARGAINGQGIQNNSLGYQQAITSADFATLMNYALLTNAKILNDAS